MPSQQFHLQYAAALGEQERRRYMTQAQIDAEDKAKADQKAAERSTVTESWQDLYNTGGDKAVADYITTNYKKGGTGWRESDLNHARQVINTPGSTFTSAAKADYDKAYASWDKLTRYGAQTKYGAYGQTLKELMPWEKDSGYNNLSNYDDFNFSGWVDPQIQIDEDNAAKAKAKAEADKAAKAQRKAEVLATSQKQTQAELTNSVNQKNQSVQNAFYGSNNQINQGADRNREEAVERAQEYQNTSSNKAVNNIEKSSTSSKTSSNNNNASNPDYINTKDPNQTPKSSTNNNASNPDYINTKDPNQTPKSSTDSGYVQQLADNAINDYTQKWRNNKGSTTNYSNIFTNNIKQDVGNSGNWSTNFGNNNKLNNVRAGNDYSLNLGNINLRNN